MNTSASPGGRPIRSGFTILSFILLMSLSSEAQENNSAQRGWIVFNDSVATVLELRDTQLERLNAIDKRYREDYGRLGADPISDPNYVALTERRNADIQTVLDAKQYDLWMRMNDLENEDSRSRPGFGPAGADSDRRDPQTPERERDARSNMGGSTPKSGSDR